jgi:hypothetical protein
MNSWAPLWSGLVDSSIWEEKDHVFRVFMAMMSLKDSNHLVTMDGYKLARRIHMDIRLVNDALRVLSEPDKKRPGQPNGGRRIKAVDGGWLILNGEYYRQMVRDEMRRARNRRAQQAYRDRKKLQHGSDHSGEERAFVKSIENDEPVEKQDAIVERTLPEPKHLEDDDTPF